MWVFVVVLLVALMIPITAILLESPLGRSVARRLEGQGDGGGGGGEWGRHAAAGAAGGCIGNRPRGPEPLHRWHARRAAVRPAPAGRPRQEEASLLSEGRGAGGGGGGRHAAQVAGGILVTRVLGYVR